MNEKQKEILAENRFEILFMGVGLIMYAIGCHEEDLMMFIAGLVVMVISYMSTARTVMMKKIGEIKDSISELQGYLERLGGPDEAAEQDPPKMEEHL